jgi:processive 1,2-diacylglycerol beta-glucosyltransferase
MTQGIQDKGKKRVLILSASAGTGHLRAAEALAKTFQKSPEVAEVLNDDALEYSATGMFRELYSTLYNRLVRSAPSFVGWWYDRSDKPFNTAQLRLILDRLNTGPLVSFIRDFQPHIIVCTHFMPANVIAHLIARRRLSAHLSTVVTDYDIHAMWLSKAFHRYFVALDETKIHLMALGLPEKRITVSGIPVDPVFSAPVDADAVRKDYKLAPDRATLLVSAGALGVSPTESVVRRLLNIQHRIQAVVICGKNEELRGRVEKLAGGDTDAFRILGYTTEMHKLMRIADLFIGKPGGLTTSECMVCGLPMVIIAPIPGQEDRNSDHLLEKGCAIKCNEITVLPYKVDRLLDKPERMQAMRESCLRLARPDAAQCIVDSLLNEAGLPPMKVTRQLRKKMVREAKDS